jgi:hypothetical protein
MTEQSKDILCVLPGTRECAHESAVTRVHIDVQLIHAGGDACSYRIKMDISDKFKKVGFFLAEERLVAVLKQVTVTSVALVERDGVAGEKAGHQRGNRNGSGAKKEMDVVSEDRPCIA